MTDGAARAPQPVRPRWGRAVVAALVLLSAVLTLVLLTRNHGDTPAPLPTPTGSTSASPVPQQATLLVQVGTDEQVAVNNLLLGTYQSGGASTSVGVQPQLVVAAPVEEVTFGRSYALSGRSPSADALSNLLGIRIDGSWSLGRLAFSGLVDSIGGVQVDVPAPLLVKNPNGTIRFSLDKGIQTLDGPQATLYVQTLLPGEVEAQRMARFQDVFRQIMVRLPPDRLRVEELLGSLGALSSSTVPTAQLATFLLSMRADYTLDRVTKADLPVQAAGAGATDLLRLDGTPAAQLVDGLFAQVRLVVGPQTPVRAMVRVAVPAAGVGLAARSQLAAAGLVPLAGGAVAPVAATSVLVPAGVPGSPDWGAQVAKALGLPARTVIRTSGSLGTADVVVVLGADYVPTSTPTPAPSIS